MKNNYDIKFCFKGARTYVHGTDIFNKVVEYLNTNNIKILSSDLSFHAIATKNITIADKKPTDETILKFTFKYIDDSNTKYIIYGFDNKKKINCRYDYDEDIIYKASQLDDEKKEILLSKDTNYSFVENIVAMNKYMLKNLFPDANGKWYFTRLQLKENIKVTNNNSIKLLFKSNFNFKLTKTDILINDKSIGFIYFSLI